MGSHLSMIALHSYRSPLETFPLDLLQPQRDTGLVRAELLDVRKRLDVRAESLQAVGGELLRGEVLQEGRGRDARVLLGVADRRCTDGRRD